MVGKKIAMGAVAVVMALSVTACGNDDSDSKDAKSHESPAINLSPALLTTQEVPPGYKKEKNPEQSALKKTSNHQCTELFSSDNKANIMAGIELEQRADQTLVDPQGNSITQSIVVLKDTNTATSLMTKTRDALGPCKSWTENREGNISTALGVSETQIPFGGNDSLAAKVAITITDKSTGQSINGSGSAAIIRVGKYIVAVSQTGATPNIGDDIQKLGAKCKEKLTAIAK
jgi:hypothetical protein